MRTTGFGAWLQIIGAAGLLVVAPPGADAQRPPQIKHEVDQQWGQVILGTVTTMDPATGSAAVISIQTTPGEEVVMTYLLPDRLDSNDVPGDFLPLSYTETSGIFTEVRSEPGAGTYFDPRVPFTYRPLNSNGKVWFYLGGTLEVPFEASAGGYTGIIAVEATLTGN